MPAKTPEEIHTLMAAAFYAGDVDAFVELHARATSRAAIRAALEPIFASANKDVRNR